MQLPLSAPLPVKGRMRTTTCVPLSNVHYMLLHADSYFSTFTLQPGVPACVEDPGRLHANCPQQVSCYLLRAFLLLPACPASGKATPSSCTVSLQSTTTFHAVLGTAQQ